jgi:hypothetical protein
MKHLFILIFVLVTYLTGYAQLNSLENLDDVSKEGFFKKYMTNFMKGFTDFGDPFTLSGSVGFNLRSYDAFGGPLRQDPFFYTVNSNVNIRIYQIDIPFSMVLTARNTTSSFPSFSDLRESLREKINNKRNGFARVGFSPYYKWAKLHLGHRSMNFSKYTLSNLNFFGAGTELTPGKVRFSAMYGRLAQAEPIDLSLVTPNLPVYRRVGWGTKIGYGDDKASADIILFTAKDDETSVVVPGDYPKQVSPEANFALGVQLQKLFFEKVRVKVDYTRSGVSPNVLDATANDGSITDFLLKKRNTSYYGNALEASAAFEGKTINAGLLINRVDNTFRTFGAYFFNRDIQDIQGFAGFGLLEGKLNTMVKAGVQRNNLDGSKPTTTTRLIYDIQTAWSHKDLNVQGNYSNNASNVGYVLNPQLDSLNAVVITQDLGINSSYVLPLESEHVHTVTLTGNMQDVSDDIEKPDRTSVSKLYLFNAGYNLKTISKWTFSARANYTRNEVESIRLNRLGLGIGIQKPLLNNKMMVGFNSNYFNNKNDAGNNSSNLSAMVNMTTQLFTGMSVQFSWGLLQTVSKTIPTFTESTGNLGLQYNFQYAPGKNKKN